jgi:hypothetical protein
VEKEAGATNANPQGGHDNGHGSRIGLLSRGTYLNLVPGFGGFPVSGPLLRSMYGSYPCSHYQIPNARCQGSARPT